MSIDDFNPDFLKEALAKPIAEAKAVVDLSKLSSTDLQKSLSTVRLNEIEPSIVLVEKYSDDQPRDDNGRWSGGGAQSGSDNKETGVHSGNAPDHGSSVRVESVSASHDSTRIRSSKEISSSEKQQQREQYASLIHDAATSQESHDKEGAEQMHQIASALKSGDEKGAAKIFNQMSDSGLRSGNLASYRQVNAILSDNGRAGNELKSRLLPKGGY